MKFLHLSDLHLGKRFNEFSMIEDQKYILKEILSIVLSEKPDAVIIAGDVYDKSVPSTEAVELFDEFIYELSKCNVKVFIISGNHDSAERLSFASRLISREGIYFSPVYKGEAQKVTLSDEFGDVDVYMLPFVRPANVRAYFPEKEIHSYSDAVEAAVESMSIDSENRNVLITHQFVTGAERSESEDVSVGGTDNVAASVFGGFDYVALGHIHKAQNIGTSGIRYCGTPLKYSFSEAKDEKSVTVVVMQEKGKLEVSEIPLKPLHDVREIKGKYQELVSKSAYEGTATNDYIRAVLTDEDEILNAMDKLRVIYPNIMKLNYDNRRSAAKWKTDAPEAAEQKTPIELFNELYLLQNGDDLDDEKRKIVEDIIEKLQERGEDR